MSCRPPPFGPAIGRLRIFCHPKPFFNPSVICQSRADIIPSPATEGLPTRNVVGQRRETLETYVVRIYRTDRETSGVVLGVVERVGSGGKRGFTTVKELVQLLDLSKAQPRKIKVENE